MPQKCKVRKPKHWIFLMMIVGLEPNYFYELSWLNFGTFCLPSFFIFWRDPRDLPENKVGFSSPHFLMVKINWAKSFPKIEILMIVRIWIDGGVGVRYFKDWLDMRTGEWRWWGERDEKTGGCGKLFIGRLEIRL